MRFLFKNLRYVCSREFACDIGAILATCQRNERGLTDFAEEVRGRLDDINLEQLAVKIELQELPAMTSKLDQVNQALTEALSGVETKVDTLSALIQTLGAAIQKLANDANQVNVQDPATVQLFVDKVNAIAEKFTPMTDAAQTAFENAGVIDAKLPDADVEAEIPNPEQPEETQDGQV